MHQLRRILTATDFSAQADVAVSSAATLAREFDAAIHLVTVVKPPAFYQRWLDTSATEETAAKWLASGNSRLEQLAEAADLSGLRVDCEARGGVAFAEIIAAARSGKDDLIVVGTGARWRLDRLVLGGTAERVLRKAPVPVLVTKTALPPRPRTILAPTDFSRPSCPAIGEAVILARRWSAHLVLLHVIEPIVQTSVWPAESSQVALYPVEPAELEPDWQLLLSGFDLSGVSWEKQTAKGYAGATIVHVGERLHADLIVMGTHGRSMLAHALLGSVTEHVARQASCSILSVRPDAAQFEL